MEIKWNRSQITREIMKGRDETFTQYTSDAYPNFRIESWGSEGYGVFEGYLSVTKGPVGTFCSTRSTLREAKNLVHYLATDVD